MPLKSSLKGSLKALYVPFRRIRNAMGFVSVGVWATSWLSHYPRRMQSKHGLIVMHVIEMVVHVSMSTIQAGLTSTPGQIIREVGGGIFCKILSIVSQTW